MKNDKFYTELAKYTKEGDINSANSIIMFEIGKSLVNDREDFIALLKSSGIYAEPTESDTELIQKFINNISTNKQLIIGTAFLVGHKNKVESFDGEEEISDAGVKAMNKVIHSYFDTRNIPDSADNYYSDASGDVVSSVAQGVGELAKLGSSISQGQQKKKYGALDLASKKEEAKQQIVKAAMEQRIAQQQAVQKQKEQKAKTTRTALIIGGSVLGVALIATVIYLIKKKK